MDLFGDVRKKNFGRVAPLAARMRPRTLDEFAGQQHFLGAGKLLRRMLEADRLRANSLYAEIAHDAKYWPRHAKEHNREWLQRAQAALASASPRQ